MVNHITLILHGSYVGYVKAFRTDKLKKESPSSHPSVSVEYWVQDSLKTLTSADTQNPYIK
jgi:hypothetical protein